jgi:hypothetical protein
MLLSGEVSLAATEVNHRGDGSSEGLGSSFEGERTNERTDRWDV